MIKNDNHVRTSVKWSQDALQYKQVPLLGAEFDWICGSKAYLRSFFSQVQFFGVLIGTVVYGSLSDWLGRKPVAVTALSLGIVFSILSGVAPTWELLLGTRFFIGLSIGGTLVVVCTFVMEMLLPQQRMALRAFFNWGTARLMVTLICWWFPNWRSASIACAVTALPALLIVIFVFPESPTWLHNKGRIEKMKQSERKIARVAGKKHVETDIQPVVHKKSIIELFKDINLFKRVVVLWAMWFTAAICGYAIDLNSSDISGHLFWNQILFSCLIAASKIALVVFDSSFPKFSRRNLHQGAQLIVCICFLILTVLVIVSPHSIFILIINLIGTMFLEYTWDACYLCGVESMPTNMRATTMGSCSFMARIGAILAPTLAFLNSFWAPSAYLTVCSLGLINLIISYLWLVETKGVVLDKVNLDMTGTEIKEDPENVEMLSKDEKQ
ncbi:unnamed protein product [Bursaphelenchus okinawaensis]|uniref:Major facilitator superfamily (MFS) profile domain-containing protein n=1 Tax=Bursaphelenchus okinawaensis TaxID=465554 RepID=A0A811KNL0_9BILA|nr:unnamed protein product [Bursaphelenchus okinawaensis]CAG9108450.1 unnamed protein product [Bursaphelenchus okinawaensis]